MDPRVVRTIEYLRNHPGPNGIATLATRVGLGRSQLEHLFKRDTGTSIRRYVTERRLLAAADRLRTSDDRISEIAWRVGYTDPSNFNHAFMKRFGTSPTEYRRSALPLCNDRDDALVPNAAPPRVHE
jgi:AraC-like DNA-binding protein